MAGHRPYAQNIHSGRKSGISRGYLAFPLDMVDGNDCRSRSHPESRDNQMFVLVAAVFIAVMVVPAVYAMYAGKINGPLLELAKKELWMFSGLDEPGQTFAMLSRVDPAELDWATMDKILTYAGSWLRWPLLLVLGALIGISCFFGSVEKLKRKLDMEKLLSENSRNFPCLLPIVGKGKYLLSSESYDKGPWRIALAQYGIPLYAQVCLNFLPAIENGAFHDPPFTRFSEFSGRGRQYASARFSMRHRPQACHGAMAPPNGNHNTNSAILASPRGCPPPEPDKRHDFRIAGIFPCAS